ncbi:conserved hypothetical protein [Ricinus communis]|uniref:Uncharacterized protein n=1 Tax=Ricinus communis TaxID=3988 RepID=B9RYL7_RICCO|nr:conserved hypothetical protein [Ricinus communis]
MSNTARFFSLTKEVIQVPHKTPQGGTMLEVTKHVPRFTTTRPIWNSIETDKLAKKERLEHQ